MANNNIKIGFFIDGNYILHSSNYYNYVHGIGKRFSIAGLMRFFIHQIAKDCKRDESDCIITERHFFRGRLNATDAQQRGNQLYNDRVFDDVLMTDGVETHFLPLRNFSGKKEERGVDVWLSLECFEKALCKGFDYVILVASDTDYVPLVRKLTSLGIKVVLASWEFDYITGEGHKVVTRTSQELLSVVQLPFRMSDIIEQGYNSGSPNILDLFIINPNIKPDGEIIISELTRIDRAGDVFIQNKPEDTDLSSATVERDEVSEILSLKSGYGFIKYPNNNLFFHNLDFVGDFEELVVGDTVEFNIGKNSQGDDVAKNVIKLVSIDAEVPEEAEQHKSINNSFFSWSSK